MIQFVKTYFLLALTACAMAATLLLSLAGLDTASRAVATSMIAVACLWIGVDMFRSLLRKHYGLDILALVAIIACVLVGEYLASLIIVLMLTGGEALEAYAGHRATGELASLLERKPTLAHRVDEAGQIIDLAAGEVRVGDTLLVRPGEQVPVDGQLLDPQATFDESSLTGEFLPVTRSRGEQVYSGSVNGSRAVRLQAVRTADDSQYQQIIALVRQARESKAPVARLADRFAIPFTLFSLLLAGGAWLLSGDPLRFAQVLVLATPCPLLIAVPVAFLGGMSKAAKSGIIVKGGAVIERLAAVRGAAFDKTGTLTSGRPELVRIIPSGGINEDRLLQLVASAEQYSSHVMAAGISKAATGRGLELLAAQDAREIATNGVIATVQGHRVAVGKPAFIASLGARPARVDLESGQTAAYASIDGEFAGALVLADTPRPEARDTLAWLSSHGIERQVMLTGDVADSARLVAGVVGIEEVHAELLPGGKVQLLDAFTPRPLMMVGDGVNDAPALATADVGIAMGSRGSTAAGQAADAVILRDSLAPVAEAVAISRFTYRVALSAIWIGVALSVGLMLVATTGVIPAVLGALLQEVVDLVVIIYALRTLRGPR